MPKEKEGEKKNNNTPLSNYKLDICTYIQDLTSSKKHSPQVPFFLPKIKIYIVILVHSTTKV